jgi:hypothetical protein
MGLSGHANRGICSAILLIVAAALDELEKEAVIEAIRVSVEELAVVITVVEQVETLQLSEANVV